MGICSICPERTAICCDGQSVTYGELELYSERLARHIEQQCGQNYAPIAVYGHKHPLMPAAFLACVKSGRAYCPIDTSVPDSRVEMILDAWIPRFFSPSLLSMRTAGINESFPCRILMSSYIQICPAWNNSMGDTVPNRFPGMISFISYLLPEAQEPQRASRSRKGISAISWTGPSPWEPPPMPKRERYS